jgi:hypothetical protein
MDFVINRYKSITSLNVQSQEIFIMLNKHKLQRIAIATSAFLAFGTTHSSPMLKQSRSLASYRVQPVA